MADLHNVCARRVALHPRASQPHYPTICFRSQPPPHARADDTADLPSVSHRAISACSAEKQRVTLGILCLQRSTECPAVT